MKRCVLFLAVACAKQTTPVQLAENTAIDPLPAASSAPAPVQTAPAMLPIKDNEIVLPSPILFQTAKDVILPQSEPTLAKIVEIMVARRDITLLRVEGHSDSMGSAAYNLALTQKRAEAVGKWLVDHGVECSRVEAVGYGQTRPIVPNVTEEGRAKNRRIAFVIANGAPATKTMC